MKLREIDKQPIFVANLKGFSLDNEPIYTEVKLTYGQVNDTGGRVSYNEYGVLESYKLKVLLEYNDINKYTNEFTRFWINHKVNLNEDNYNYVVSRMSDWKNGIMELYLKPAENDYDKLYIYEESLGIYTFQCNYDKEKYLIKLKDSDSVIIDKKTKVWFKEPTDITSTKYLLQLSKIIRKDNYIYYYMTPVDDD